MYIWMVSANFIYQYIAQTVNNITHKKSLWYIEEFTQTQIFKMSSSLIKLE